MNINQSQQQFSGNSRKVQGKIKILLSIAISLIILALIAVFYIKNDLYGLNLKSGIFEIKEGQGVMEILDSLKEKNLIRNKWIMLIYLKLKNYDKKLKAGIYELPKTNSPVDVIEVIVSGKTALQKITILEGWTIKEIAEYLDERGIVKKDDFLASAKREKWNFDFLENSDSLEGYLFPDTYYVSYKASSEDIIRKMLENFDKKLTNEIKEEIKKQEKSIKEVVTLASIIEKEVYKEEDRKIVAGIFLKRLFQGKPLEADSTINYITGKNTPQPSFEDTRTDSEYNTYLNPGLPPDPICNPSLSSILAALYPKETDYFFYLNRQDTKETLFSKSYEEHLENKRKYLK